MLDYMMAPVKLGRTRQAVTAILVSVFLLLGASTPSLAGQLTKAGGPSAPSGYVAFGIQPSGPSAVDKRPWFVYVLKPGSTLLDYVAIESFSSSTQRIRLYARDAIETNGGGLGVQEFSQRPVQVGSWIHLLTSSVLAPPDKAVIVPFTIRVPRNASPGDHVGGILASIIREGIGAHGSRIQIEERVGERVYVRVTGPLHPKLVISGLVAHYADTWSPFAGGTFTVTYTLRNVGNLDLSAPSVLRLTNPFGWSRTVRQSGNPPDILPGSFVQVTRVIDGVYPAFRVDSTVNVDPGFSTASTDSGLNETSVRLGDASASTGTWAIPWPSLGLLLLLILAVASAVYIRSRRRRADRRPHTAPPEGEAVLL